MRKRRIGRKKALWRNRNPFAFLLGSAFFVVQGSHGDSKEYGDENANMSKNDTLESFFSLNDRLQKKKNRERPLFLPGACVSGERPYRDVPPLLTSPVGLDSHRPHPTPPAPFELDVSLLLSLSRFANPRPNPLAPTSPRFFSTNLASSIALLVQSGSRRG